jgi:asparagine N-glycosylation enzyme membrane subunit Stt3
MDEQKQNKKSKTAQLKLLPRNNEIIICIILFLIAFGIRMITYYSIFVGNNIRFLEFDPFYHMRRVVSFTQFFPWTWNFDTFLNFPYGSVVGWPPIFDWTIALLANIVGLGHPNRYLIETVGVYFPAFLGSLSVVAVYFIGKEIFGDFKNDNKESDIVTKITKKSKNVKANGRSWKNIKN